MDFLLKWVTGRTVAVFCALAALIWAADTFQQYPRAAYQRWRYPPQKGDSKASASIERELDAKESLRLRALHRQVSAEISAAQARGRQVAGLQRLADSILSLDMPGYRLDGMERLNGVRMRIPQGESVRAISPEDDQVDVPPDVRGKARRRAR